VVRKRGAAAMREMLEQARPLVDLVWDREIEAEPLDTPERRAGLEARLMAAVETIKHPGVKKAYERELRDRLYWHFRPQRQPGGPSGGQSGGQYAGGKGRTAQIPGKKGPSPGPAQIRGLGLIVRTLESPMIFEQAREAISGMAFDDSDVAAIRDAAFHILENTEMLDRTAVAAHLRNLGRKRAVELLEIFPVGQPKDPRSAEGLDLLDALARFPVASKLAGEVRATIEAEGEGKTMSRPHEARIKAGVLGRRRASRSVVEEAVTGSASEGVQELRDALGGMGAAMEQKRPED
jgi:DNA primase